MYEDNREDLNVVEHHFVIEFSILTLARPTQSNDETALGEVT